jgi:hypothetical protein
MAVGDQTAGAHALGLKPLVDRLTHDYLIARRASDPDRANQVLDQIAALHYEHALATEEHSRRR